MKAKIGSWMWLALFACLWCALRVFWLDCDPGVPSVWEYGYYVTDEGYYMGAGKDKFLWGAFNDLSRGECFNYGYSAGTHWLSYLAYRVAGLTDWGWRVPFVMLYLLAWCMVFRRASRRCGGAAAFMLCAAVSCMPFVVAYERSAGNDLTIAALGAIAFCLGCGRGVWRIPASAVVCACAVLVKPSVWILLPIVGAGVLSERKTRSVWLDFALFAVLSVLAVFAFKQLAVLSVVSEAAANGMPAAEIVRRTTSHSPLPSLFAFASHFRGIASFPRDPMTVLMSVSAVFMTLFPLAQALREVVLRRWSWRILLYLAVPLYVAAVSVMNGNYLHYYHPAVVMLPLVLSEMVGCSREDGGPDKVEWRKTSLVSGLFFAVCALVLVFAATRIVKPQDCAEFYSRIYNLPSGNVWMYNGGLICVFGAAVALAIAALRGFGAFRKEGWLWFLLGCIGGSVSLSCLPAIHLAPSLKTPVSHYLAPAALMFFTSASVLLAVFGLPLGSFRRRVILFLPPVAVVLSFLLVPGWRSATAELLKPGIRESRAVAAEIAKIVPENAIVIGERSSQVLMGVPIRTATTMHSSDPVPVVEGILKKDPAADMYVLADSQHAYILQHFMKRTDRYRLDLRKRFKMRSFANGSPADVFLCKLHVLPAGPKK